MTKRAEKLRIGTSGYQYDHWKGPFYPHDLPKRRWFEHYASHFDTVEINNTFYRLPGPHTFESWREAAPPGFSYAVKFNRYGTHFRKLLDASATIGRFLVSAERLKQTLGPVLVHLPPRWKVDRGRLDEFLAAAPDSRSFTRHRRRSDVQSGRRAVMLWTRTNGWTIANRGTPMLNRTSTWALTLACLVAVEGVASAQIRLPGGRRGTTAANQYEELKTQADQAYQRGNYDQTLQLTERVLREQPRDHVALYLRGSARIEVGFASSDPRLVREGIADVREAIRHAGTSSPNPNYYLPYLARMTRLTNVEGRRDHAETAVKVADQVLGSLPRLTAEHRANLLYQRGNAQVALANYDRAIADFQAALEQQQQHLGALVGLADANAQAGRQQQALEAYTRAVRAFPDNPLVYNNRGMYLQRQRRFDEAITDFTRALELDPRYVFAYTNRGFTLLEAGNAQAAEADFTVSLRVDPNQPGVHSLRGTARIAQGRLREALADHRRVVELDRNSAVARADLGFTYFFSGDYGQALEAFNHAITLDPQMRYIDPWRFLALERLGRTDEAKQVFAESLRKPSASRDWNDQLLSFLAGAHDAESLLKSVNTSTPEIQSAQLCEAHFFIGQQKLLASDEQAATDHFRQALDTGARHLSAYRGAEFALKRYTAAGGARSAPAPLR